MLLQITTHNKIIALNSDDIKSIEPDEIEGAGSVVYMKDDNSHYYCCKETPDELYKKLEGEG
jgi:hypothetical protein